MKTMNWSEVLSAAVAKTGKPAVWVNNELEYTLEKDTKIWHFVMDSMKTLYGDETTVYFNVIRDLVYGGLFVFDSEEDRDSFYRVFEQPLTDSSAIYACTFDNTGKVLTENT